MEEKTQVVVDQSQVNKAVKALLAYLKSSPTKDSSLLEDTQPISLLFTLWKIPRQAQTIRIPLPHGQRPDTDEVCLFTRDEPNMTAEQTQRFYKTLLEKKGVKYITEVIPFKMLKTEYKPFEAKRRLLGNFNMFLSDDRIRRLLPSHIGRHFYERKKEPLSINLMGKSLAWDVQRLVQGTNLKVTNKGCCCTAHVGNSGLTAEQLVENIESAVQTVMAKIKMTGPVLKVIHLKSKKSVALPIYTSDLNHLKVLDEAKLLARTKKKEKRKAEKNEQAKQEDSSEKGELKPEEQSKDEEAVKEDEEEEIPQLVPIETPTKKAKLEGKKKQPLKKTLKPTAVKKGPKAEKKLSKKAVKRKVPKVK
ncbi:ribosomal L1 domain-containing protein 1 [Synchiropus splendidus]|uniref:ribosomal L1 domain-containing protein 1 n=1 Tax=Synchiropus splendidus TaxID=270530 RepID=UPI00237D8AB9|nr:ribosomal L1 domain-containing protein 1 [Synchiropus splendidus]